jgi:hypothetical protein
LEGAAHFRIGVDELDHDVIALGGNREHRAHHDELAVKR